MSIVENLNKIKSCKEDIKQAIIDKGVDMTDVAFTEYATKIGEIQAGGGISDYLEFKETVTTYNSNRTSIPSYAFVGCGLTSVNLPKCETVGDYAFNVTPIQNVNLPECKSLGHYAFMNCNALTSVNLPVCKSLGQYAFQNCNALTSVNLPVCKYIASGGFYYCLNLSTIYIPCCEEVETDGFAYTHLENVNLPECKRLGYNVFYDCQPLTSVDLPKCYEIYGSSFQNCVNLSNVNLPMCNNINEAVFNNCQSLTFIDLPVCHHLGPWTFEFSHALQRVNVPMCELIEENAFGDCTSLTELDLSKSYHCVLSNEDCFYNSPIANGNGSIYVHNSVLERFRNATNWSRYADCFVGVGDENESLIAFDEETGELSGITEYISTNFQDVFGVSKEQVRSINLPNVKEISADNIFSDCTFETINLESVVKIENAAFRGCTIENPIEAPICEVVGFEAFSDSIITKSEDDTFIDSCVEIGDGAFSGVEFMSNSGSEELNFPNCKVIGEYAFSCVHPSFNIQIDSCVEIGEYAFSGSEIVSINALECKTIGNRAFSGSNLHNGMFDGCETIGEYAFAQCYNLTDINISNCKYIGYGAFSECDSLFNIFLQGDTVVKTADYIGDLSNVNIRVTEGMVEEYKNDPYWSVYADRIVDY